jgi:aspartyl aminopeptidase
MPLEYKTTNVWEAFASDEHRQAMQKLAGRYLDFLSANKTERQVIAWCEEHAHEAGFGEPALSDESVQVMRSFRGKSLFLARRGKQPLVKGFRLICAHADSPRLDLKQRPLYEECGVGQAKTHYYGGIRKHQWLARPLALHGVVATTDGRLVRVSIGEAPDEPVFTVPDLLPHLAADQNEKKLSKAFDAEKLNIVVGHAPWRTDQAEDTSAAPAEGGERKPIKRHVLEILHGKYGIEEEDLFSAELQAVPAGPARYVGLDRALIGGYGQDDRVCVFLGLEALLRAKSDADEAPEHTQILVVWDKEEIGSDGSTGAKSYFFEHCMQELLALWGQEHPPADGPETCGLNLAMAMYNGKAISADVHGALDPDYQDLHEKLNAALVGHGPVFCKFTGHRGKYGANDAHAEYVAWLRGLMARAGVPWQMAELGKVDIGGGGTVAKHLAVYGMDIIDFGPPLLSMHSPFELASTADIYATLRAFEAFLRS